MTTLTARIGVALAAAACCAGQPQPTAPTTTGVGLLQEAIAVLSKEALGRERIDWTAVERELAGQVKQGGGPSEAHVAIAAAVAQLNDPHARFIPSTPPAPSSQPPAAASAPPEKPGSPPPVRPAIPSVPQGHLLDDGVAYLVVPGCSAPDVEGLRAYAAAAAAELKRLDELKPEAWVIDLRLNGGGNLWPMLLGLRPLLGDGPHMTMVRGDKVESHFGVGPTGSWIDWGQGRGPEVQLSWPDPPPKQIERYSGRIGVLLGGWTMSSGESLAICLAGHDTNRTFGEKTAGLTTVTNTFTLSDGSVLNIPVSRMGDRSGHAIVGPIEPMQIVPFEDWPNPDDQPARAARAWVLQK